MSSISECALDRHFTAQLRKLRLYSQEHPISKEECELRQCWMDHLQQAKGEDKYARNCMTLMMYDQFQQTGHLRKPFTEVENIQRSMDDLLNEYDGELRVEEQPAATVEDAQEGETNASCYGGGSSRCSKEVAVANPLPEFESVKQSNQDLLKEIDSLHSRTLETEQHYKTKSQLLEQKMAEKTRIDQQESIYRACRGAIDLLKSWPGDQAPLNFLATCLEPLLRSDLVSSTQISELDRSLEDVLDRMVKQICTRRDENVRILYDHILHNQQDMIKEREGKVRRIQESLKLERQRLQLLSEDLKRREDLIWRHQSIVTIPRKPSEEPASPRNNRVRILSQGKVLQNRANRSDMQNLPIWNVPERQRV
ncbi:uncharacterized protein LOC128258301 [Drosophila gunungcola]|uniref:Uncharacterized protein n=1 Tax=Drosophila gunungcola TaxID=103775 RepID=A0A9Q0BPW2_9MUSC|nr:uncharacterized protein LOC128258301 [Drosophila gunungcola]KAI8040352.1 hypothetical protein M5D96_006292 [Drosophila gunungcola]